METIIILSEEEKKEFIELTKPLYNISPSKEMNLYLSLVKYASEKIPTRIKKLLDKFKKKHPKVIYYYLKIFHMMKILLLLKIINITLVKIQYYQKYKQL
jgi:hypothetical protein